MTIFPLCRFFKPVEDTMENSLASKPQYEHKSSLVIRAALCIISHPLKNIAESRSSTCTESPLPVLTDVLSTLLQMPVLVRNHLSLYLQMYCLHYYRCQYQYGITSPCTYRCIVYTTTDASTCTESPLPVLTDVLSTLLPVPVLVRNHLSLYLQMYCLHYYRCQYLYGITSPCTYRCIVYTTTDASTCTESPLPVLTDVLSTLLQMSQHQGITTWK